MKLMGESSGKTNTVLKSIIQSVLACLLGITGTYATQMSEIRQLQATQNVKLIAAEKAIESERQDRLSADKEARVLAEDRMKNVTILLETLLKQNTEVITLFRVQQQVVK